MNSILAIEWLKIKKYRTFWVLIIFFFALLPLWNIFIYKGFISSGPKGGINFLSQAYSFPSVWANFGFWGSIFILFPSILMIILTANEYGFRTHRQNVIDGWSRLQAFHAKCLMVLSLSIISTLYLFITGALMGISVSGGTTFFTTDLKMVGYFFLLSLNYLGFAFFITTLIRKSGLSIGLFLLYSLILENMLKGIMNWFLPVNYGNLLPLQSSDELLPLPFMKMATGLLSDKAAIPDYTLVLFSLGWCLVYYLIGRRLILRRDW